MPNLAEKYAKLGKAAKFHSLYDIGGRNLLPASGLWSGSGSKVNQFVHVPTSVGMQHFIQILAQFLSNLAHKQTDKRTQACGQKHYYTSSEVFVGGKKLQFQKFIIWIVILHYISIHISNSVLQNTKNNRIVKTKLQFLLIYTTVSLYKTSHIYHNWRGAWMHGRQNLQHYDYQRHRHQTSHPALNTNPQVSKFTNVQ